MVNGTGVIALEAEDESEILFIAVNQCEIGKMYGK